MQIDKALNPGLLEFKPNKGGWILHFVRGSSASCSIARQHTYTYNPHNMTPLFTPDT